MNDLEHQFMFDRIIADAAAVVIEMRDISIDEAKVLVAELLVEWWSPALLNNINKRGVKAEIVKSLVAHIQK